MKIEPSRPSGAHAPSAARHGDAGFTVAAPATGAPAAPARPASALLPAHAVLALQSLDEGPQKRARHVRRGHDSLDALERLKLSLIDGAGAGDAPATLHRLFAEREATGDDVLDAIMGDIDLRVAVELAKLERR